MSRQRTGPIFTQEILNNLISTMEAQLPADQSDETVFQEKVRALQRFLNHGMCRFSTESLQQILDSILPPRTPGTPGDRSHGRPTRKMEVRSIKELRNVVKMIMTKRESGSIRASDADALKYMEHFFFAVYCMTEAKRLIDDVFADLYYSYYKPESESRQPTRLGSAIMTHTAMNVEHHTEDYSQFGISTLEQLSGSTGHKLRLTVKDMQDVLTRWAELLTQGEPDPSSFEPESEQDLLLVRTAFHTQPILRLLPDTFAKFYKCLELSKQWWVLAHDVYPDLPFQRHPPGDPGADLDQTHSPSEDSSDVDQDKANLPSQVVLQTKEAIREINSEIEAVHEELEALSKREEKFSILVETYDKVGQDIDTRNLERQQLYALRDRLMQSGQKDASNREELQQTEAGIRQLDGMIKLLEFQHSLLLQDYLIHMEIRPSIIRFQGEAALKLKDAQLQLEQQAVNLEKLEQEISAAPPQDDAMSKDTENQYVAKDSPVALTSLSGEAEDDKKDKDAVHEKQIQKTVRKNSHQEINKANISQRYNSKRKVAFVQNDLKGDASLSNKKAPPTPGKLSEKNQGRVSELEHPPTKSIVKEKGDNFALPRAKRNSLPSVNDQQKRTQQVDRRKSHDVSIPTLHKTAVRETGQVKRDSSLQLHTSEKPDNSKKKLPDERNIVAGGNNRLNPLVKSISSKDVLKKPQVVAADIKSSRTRSSSDPPVIPSDTLTRINKKLSPSKAWEKTPTSSETTHALRNRAPRPRPAPALQNNNNYVK